MKKAKLLDWCNSMFFSCFVFALGIEASYRVAHKARPLW
ncbi:MAG: hypothetical protein TRG1_579 [Flavobacteriaceae bacterium FS1-H7996/R]|nr:MAG: hypothetical protein TRG1_579 [Flavobacteriaceae bacterium FS1-H7996/R]